MNKRTYDKAIRMMQKGQYTLSELGIMPKDIIYIKNLENNVKMHYDPRKEDYVYYLAPYDDMAYIVISEASSEPETVKILEMSDIHTGCKTFDEKSLRTYLEKAVKNGTQYVHIAGDLFDGNGVYRGHEKNLRYHLAKEQIDKLYSILCEYDLWYIATIGNHDESFCTHGGVDPVSVLEERMARSGRRFTYLNAFEGNIVHKGVVFRLIHLKGNMSKSKSYPPQRYLGNVLRSNFNNVILGGKEYNIRSINAGHFHVQYSLNLAGIFSVMPGNFQYDADYTKRMGITGNTGAAFVTLTIQNEKIIEYELEM